jgi:hypothetical protein
MRPKMRSSHLSLRTWYCSDHLHSRAHYCAVEILPTLLATEVTGRLGLKLVGKAHSPGAKSRLPWSWGSSLTCAPSEMEIGVGARQEGRGGEDF